ncbi:MAG: hypothetical protein LBN05_07295 [Oscillospiraceae bacterium]|jgi:hypothetical protein|nr:hypothetical protein [Oscillospiraceae bacterium]
MKKLLSILLILTVCIGLTACVIEPKTTTSDTTTFAGETEVPITLPSGVVTETPDDVTLEGTPSTAATTVPVTTATPTTKPGDPTQKPTTTKVPSTKPTVPVTAAGKATLVPNSPLLKAVKSGKFNYQYMVTGSTAKEAGDLAQAVDGMQLLFVRASDGKKNYTKFTVVEEKKITFTLIEDGKYNNALIKLSAMFAFIALASEKMGTAGEDLASIPDMSAAAALFGNKGVNMQTAVGEKDDLDILGIFKAFDEYFKNPGLYQGKSSDAKYDVEFFLNKKGEQVKYYFTKGTNELKFIKFGDATLQIVAFDVKKPAPDPKIFIWDPKVYVSSDQLIAEAEATKKTTTTTKKAN